MCRPQDTRCGHVGRTIQRAPASWPLRLRVSESLARCVPVGSRERRFVSTKEDQMKYDLEIRAAEGGDDAKQFVTDMMNAYSRAFEKVG